MTIAQKERMTSCRTRIPSFDSGGGCFLDAEIVFSAGTKGAGGVCPTVRGPVAGEKPFIWSDDRTSSLLLLSCYRRHTKLGLPRLIISWRLFYLLTSFTYLTPHRTSRNNSSCRPSLVESPLGVSVAGGKAKKRESTTINSATFLTDGTGSR